MSSTQRRAKAALSDRLRANAPEQVIDRFVGGTHTQRFADNLLPSLTQQQLTSLRGQLAQGAGRELLPTLSGKRPAHAPYSSAALAVNAFGRWLGSEEHLVIADLGGFTSALAVEAKLKIEHGGGTANLDCLLQAPDMVVGVESKLTETLEEHEPVEWKPPYLKPAMADLLHDGWAEVFDASLKQKWAPKHLGLEQLIKHALAINSRHPTVERHLIYLYWEPTNADEVPEVQAHRTEVAELVGRVGDASPLLRALSYDELFAEWSGLTQPAWAVEHVADLRARYELAIPKS